jgi:ABC-type spermidine/putrescine transport system permease subunit I
VIRDAIPSFVSDPKLAASDAMRHADTLDRLLARYGPAMLAAPGIAFIVLFFVVPVALILVQSVLGPGLTLAYYRRLFSAPEYLTVFGISFEIAFMTSVISMIASYPVAYLLVVARPPIRALMLATILLPFWTNLLIRCYAWMLLLQTTGVVNQLLVGWLHVLTAPAALVFNMTGVIVGMVHYLIPINILVLYSVMKGIDMRLVQAAKGLGANPVRAFVGVFVPLSMAGVRAAATLVFVISLGFFVTPALLGGRREITVAMLVSTYFSDVMNWGFGSALATVLLVTSLVGLSFYFAFQRRQSPVIAR